MSVLVTDANRGIGLEFVRQLVQHEIYTRYVFATYRSNGTIQELENIKKSSDRCQVILIQADVTKKEDVKSLRNSIEEIVGDKGLNLLINNAGALRIGSYDKLTEEDMLFHFKTNTVGPVSVLKEMLPLLVKGNKSKPYGELFQVNVLNISSMAGSIGDLSEIPLELVGSTISYRTSKGKSAKIPITQPSTEPYLQSQTQKFDEFSGDGIDKSISDFVNPFRSNLVYEPMDAYNMLLSQRKDIRHCKDGFCYATHFSIADLAHV